MDKNVSLFQATAKFGKWADDLFSETPAKFHDDG